MRAAIRRLFGIALTLIAVSVGLFWAAVSYARRPGNPHASPFGALPVFFNPHPLGVRDLSGRAVQAIARRALPERSRTPTGCGLKNTGSAANGDTGQFPGRRA